MKDITFHKERDKAQGAVKFPIAALHSDIQDAIDEYKLRYSLVIGSKYVFIQCGIEYLFIYVRDIYNIRHRIDIAL